jgi:hypothetical protein
LELIHRWASNNYFAKYPAFFSLPLRLAMLIIWPIRLAHLIKTAMIHFAPEVVKEADLSLLQQLSEQFYYGLRHNIMPMDYYRYGLYSTKRQCWVTRLVLQHEVPPLSLNLCPTPINQQQRSIIDDKKVFADFCDKHQLATPPILALLQNEGNKQQSNRFSLKEPGHSIFVKPRHGARGEGCTLWQYRGSSRYSLSNGIQLTWSEVASSLEQHAEFCDLIVQPLLKNHTAIKDLSLNALSCIRLLTSLTPEGKTEAIAATFKMPLRQNQIISNHGLNSPIDLQHGTLGPAVRYRPLTATFDQHPETEEQITGKVLPYWQESLALALRAHEKLQNYVFIGWDLVLTPAGPMLLEGNAGWDSLIVQKPQQLPLGQTRFVDICRMWMEYR